MKVKAVRKKMTDEEYYDKRGVLGEIVEGDVTLSLDDALCEDILSGKRKRKLRNITIKLYPLYLLSIKKVATKKGIPYQTLVRQWVAEQIRKERKIDSGSNCCILSRRRSRPPSTSWLGLQRGT